MSVFVLCQQYWTILFWSFERESWKISLTHQMHRISLIYFVCLLTTSNSRTHSLFFQKEVWYVTKGCWRPSGTSCVTTYIYINTSVHTLHCSFVSQKWVNPLQNNKKEYESHTCSSFDRLFVDRLIQFPEHKAAVSTMLFMKRTV